MFPHADFVDTYGCENNKIWVCGSFDSDAHGKDFRTKFESHYGGHDDGIALAIVPDDDFCAAFPGAVVSIKSYEYTAKYDHTWDHSHGWKPNTCKSCDIDLPYTWPPPPPPPKSTGCAVCFEWALFECKDSFYTGSMCVKALDKINDVLETLSLRGKSMAGCMLGSHGCWLGRSEPRPGLQQQG